MIYCMYIEYDTILDQVMIHYIMLYHVIQYFASSLVYHRSRKERAYVAIAQECLQNIAALRFNGEIRIRNSLQAILSFNVEK